MALAEYPEKLKTLVGLLPDFPGVYQYFDELGQVIYVGKARNLKKRVSSYFGKTHDNAKTRLLVSKIADIRHIIAPSEFEALLLENNLIKELQPRYNINLKDDKTYPWVCISNEPFPRVFYTRNKVDDGSVYFGPFASVRIVRTLTDLTRQLFKPRSCRLALTPENISQGKFKACLELQIGNCLAPCIARQTEADYNEKIVQIKSILKGHISPVIENLKSEMNRFADDFQYEKAQTNKEKIHLLESYSSKSLVVNPSISNVDVFSFADSDKYVTINYFKVTNGSIIRSLNLEYKRKIDESSDEILSLAIFDIRQRFGNESTEIIVPINLELPLNGVKITIPIIGDKKKLLELSYKNARAFLYENQKQRQALGEKKGSNRILETLQNDLHLKELPVHIECFDNSNLQGTNPVAACVVFRNGKPSKKDYRHFNVKTVEGPNDFASMEEIIIRRYKRLVNEGSSLPQLVIIDGGKGQLKSALDSLKYLQLDGSIAIIGIAKRLEEIYFPGDSIPKYLDKRSESLKLIQHLRNEAHRFGITFHRQKRSTQFLQSEVMQIKGIGPKTMQLLIQTFGSVEGLKLASDEEISIIVGRDKAQRILNFFNSNSN
jgi:excinuclease ABC subunit C